jgi:CheY-like chemotaxis protein
LSNAVKFSRDGGEVKLRAVVVPRSEVGKLPGPWNGRGFMLAENRFEEFLEISVSDTGIGVSPEGLEALFKPFSQIDSGLARKYEGTGLGLAMIKLLSELHGGTLAVESAVGEGSRFSVWLPIRTPEDVEAPEILSIPEMADAVPGERIALVIEDDFKSADLIRLQLEGEGFKVIHVVSAEAALVVADQQPIALITLDIMLPKMDGWEFMAKLKEKPALKHIPIMIVSIVADRNKGFAMGAAAVMQKPVSRQELYDSLFEMKLVPLKIGGSLKILIVDDDPRAVELIGLHVDGLASSVLRAYGGQEAIEIARREMPDLIVLDLLMPDVNGFDVVAALHEDPGTAGIPILVVTAKQITAEDRDKLNGFVSTIMEKVDFDGGRFGIEIRRAMLGREVTA